MHTYSTHIHPAEGPEVVKRGFSWPGFFFGFIWAFVKKLWIVGVVLIPFDIVLILGGEVGGEAVGGFAVLLDFVIGLVVGVNGNAWRRRNLERRGYQLVGLVKAKDAGAAMVAFEDEAREMRRIHGAEGTE